MYNFVCKCLNISIRTDELLDTQCQLLSHFEAHGPYQECQITNAQSSLVQTVQMDKFNITHCLNCELIVYAVDAAKSYWINTNLLTNPMEIAKLKSSDSYSKTFKILIKQISRDFIDYYGGNNNKSIVLDSPRIKNLNNCLRNALQQETAATDERIRQFNEQQFQLLKEYRSRAEYELNYLVDLVQRVPEQNVDTLTHSDDTVLTTKMMVTDNGGGLKLSGLGAPGNLDTPPATPDAIPMSIGNSPPLSTGGNKTPIKYAPMKGIHSSTNKNLNSLEITDSDYMFDFDGFDENHSSSHQSNQPFTDLEESDSEDPSYKRDGSGAVQISRQFGRQVSLNLAKSLPICIPDMLSQFRGSDEDDLDEETEDNVDIAASMQKLAKSVHGDAVFGDLPTRPRFSTQI